MSPRAGLDRATVVRAAAELSDSGNDWTLATLAARLGVRTPSLYNHIDGLEGLRRELALHGIHQLGSRIARAAIGRSGHDALHAVANSYRAFAKERPGLYGFTQHTLNLDDEELQEAATGVVDVLAAIMAPFELDEIDAIHAIRGFRSLLHGFVTLELSGGFGIPIDVDESFAFAVRTFITGLGGHNQDAQAT